MAYVATYINPLVQFGAVSLDLTLVDSDGIMPNMRIHKNFSDPDQVEEDALIAEAIKEIDKATEEYNTSKGI